MKRRAFVVGAAATALPLAAEAQQRKMPVVGFLRPGSVSETGYLAAFLQGLKEEGYLEDENVAIEYRFAEGENERLSALAVDLVNRGVAVIAAGGPPATFAAKSATSTIPIVFVTGDPANALELVGSLNRPRGNLTGFTVFDNAAIWGKRLELVRELMPNAMSTAMLVDPNAPNKPDIDEVTSAAGSLGLQFSILPASSDSDLETAFAAAAERRTDALLVSPTPFFTVRHERIAALAARHAMPAVYAWRDYVAAGGLISYGSSLTDVWRQIGVYVGRILKGAKPADLPVQMPARFELVINLTWGFLCQGVFSLMRSFLSVPGFVVGSPF